jgi:hypothetical protein
MEQSTVKISLPNGNTYYGVEIGDYAIVLDGGSVISRVSDTSIITIEPDTSGSVEVSDAARLRARILNDRESMAETMGLRDLEGESDV